MNSAMFFVLRIEVDLNDLVRCCLRTEFGDMNDAVYNVFKESRWVSVGENLRRIGLCYTVELVETRDTT